MIQMRDPEVASILHETNAWLERCQKGTRLEGEPPHHQGGFIDSVPGMCFAGYIWKNYTDQPENKRVARAVMDILGLEDYKGWPKMFTMELSRTEIIEGIHQTLDTGVWAKSLVDGIS